MTEQVEPGRGPLTGVRILAVEQFGAGPFATMYLADMGAEVIKIEDPGTGGDVGRYVPPVQTGSDSLYFETFNRGKRSIALDLRNPAGRQVFERLVGSADVVFNNLRGDLVQPMGLTYETLSVINQRIVCASLSAYNRHGAYAAYPGYDALMQAQAGWADLTGEPDDPPVKSGLSMVDYAAGLVTALAIVAAIFDVQRTGRGRDVDTSLYDVAIAMLTYPATWYLSASVTVERRPMSAHPSIVPFQFFPTADGYIAVACAKEKFFRALIVAMDLPALVDDPRFALFSARNEYREALLAILESRFRERNTDAWLDRLRGIVPCAPAQPYTGALDARETADSGMIVSYPHPIFEQVRTVGAPVKFGAFNPSYSRAPELGADRGSLLEEMGYDEAEIVLLRRQGAFGSSPVQG